MIQMLARFGDCLWGQWMKRVSNNSWKIFSQKECLIRWLASATETIDPFSFRQLSDSCRPSRNEDKYQIISTFSMLVTLTWGILRLAKLLKPSCHLQPWVVPPKVPTDYNRIIGFMENWIWRTERLKNAIPFNHQRWNQEHKTWERASWMWSFHSL